MKTNWPAIHHMHYDLCVIYYHLLFHRLLAYPLPPNLYTPQKLLPKGSPMPKSLQIIIEQTEAAIHRLEKLRLRGIHDLNKAVDKKIRLVKQRALKLLTDTSDTHTTANPQRDHGQSIIHATVTTRKVKK